jgi:SAM-dependent methyltransferase
MSVTPPPANRSKEAIRARYQNSRVAGEYDDRRYNDWQGRLNNRTVWRKLMGTLAGVPAGGRVLDVPCGTGRFSWHLAGAGFETTACDVSRDMLALAEKAGTPNAPAPRFLEGDLFNLPFRDREFDAVVCIRFMNLVDRPVRVETVQKLARLAPILVVAYYHPYTLKYAGRWIRHKIGLRQSLSPRLTRREFLEEIKETGCRLRELVSVAPLFSEEWLAVLEPAR